MAVQNVAHILQRTYTISKTLLEYFSRELPFYGISDLNKCVNINIHVYVFIIEYEMYSIISNINKW